MPYKVILAFESADETLKRGHSNKSRSAVLFDDAIFYGLAYKVVLTFDYPLRGEKD